MERQGVEWQHAAVSTHGRPKAAAQCNSNWQKGNGVSTHSRPKAAARRPRMPPCLRSFQHTAARRRLRGPKCPMTARRPVSTHSRPKAAACRPTIRSAWKAWFQHTAARRRLPVVVGGGVVQGAVSTHSRPKAAASTHGLAAPQRRRFNTQPPEGGCRGRCDAAHHAPRFNTQPPEGGCASAATANAPHGAKFQHTAARRRLPLLTPGGSQMLIVSTHSRPKAAARHPCQPRRL